MMLAPAQQKSRRVDLESAVSKAIRGDAAAFNAIVEQTAPRLYRLAARLMADEHEAEDVLQESYARAFDAMRAGRFDGKSQLLTWLYRIVTNTAVDAMRSRERGRRDAGAAARDEHDQGRGQAALIASAQLREIAEWLSELPLEQRSALVLKELEGLSSAQVGEVLGISEGAVEQRLVRARQTLRARVDHG